MTREKRSENGMNFFVFLDGSIEPPSSLSYPFRDEATKKYPKAKSVMIKKVFSSAARLLLLEFQLENIPGSHMIIAKSGDVLES